MRTIGSPAELERRRRLAVRRLRDGYTTAEVAAFLGVDPSTVRRWRQAARAGPGGLAARKAPGRPPKLARWQEKAVGRWLAEPATAFGFPNAWWTCPRVARLIADEFGIDLHPGYLSAWLRARRFTPQRPRRVPRERDEAALAGWLADDWPRIKRGRAVGGPPSRLSTRAGS
jgi:transposase